jgi:DNA (cytosine-5)-methyltransferase 1
MDVSINSIGVNKGKARVWLQGEMLARAGFVPQSLYEVTYADGAIVLVKLNNLLQSVSGRIRNVSVRSRNDREIPIIDLNSDRVLSSFEGLSHVRVTYVEDEIRITSLASEQRAKERLERTEARIAAGEPLRFGSLAHGGGVLSHALHTGFKEAGVKCELAFANEIREELIQHAMKANGVWTKDTIALNGPMQELAFDEEVMRNLPQLDVLECGIPCSGASLAGRVKRALSCPEAHPEVGHLLVGFLAFVARANPTAISFECVTPYFTSASMEIIRSQLRDMQYEVHEAEISGEDWNALEHRKRTVMIAVTKGMSFDFANLERPAKRARTLSEILEPIALDDDRWSQMQGLKEKELRDKANGKSFAMQIFDGASTKIATLTKGISKCRSTDPKIRHPENPDLLRNPTAIEHARAKDVPVSLIDGLSQTLAHELLGQSIVYSPFVSLGKLLASCLRSIHRKAPQLTGMPLFDAA